MSIHKTYAVLGLGRYGRAVAEELVANGAEVLAVDIDQNNVNNAIETIPVCKCADITEPEAIKRLGISNIDVVIVAMASNLEASVMAVTLCKEAGVSTVIVKCGNEMHQKILSRVGADMVIFPEKESGTRLAKNLLTSGFSEMIELSDEVSMVEIDVRDEWVGKTLIELSLRKKYSINVVAVRNGDKISTTVDPALPLEKGMQLIVIANTLKLQKLKKFCGIDMKEHKKKLIAPILVTIIMILYYVVYFGFLIALIDGVWKWLLGIIPLALSAVMLKVCIERIKEIKKGEEDDLSKY